MERNFLYQQDTIRPVNPLQQLPDFSGPGGLTIERSGTVPEIPLLQREQPDDTAGQAAPQPPTQAQLRYWWWQREQKLLIDGSRYIEPRTGVQLVVPRGIEREGFRLPSRERSPYEKDWLTLVLLLAMVLFASVRSGWQKYLTHLFQSLVSYNTAHRLFLEKNYSLLHGAVRLEAIFYLVFALFGFQMTLFYRLDFQYSGFVRYLLIFSLIIIYFTVKKILYRFIGTVVEKREVTEEYLFNIDTYNRVTGLLLIPVVALTAYFPFYSVYLPGILGSAVVLFLYLLLLFRGFAIILKKQFSIFYLFLYFCTLEILPLVLLYKIIIE